MSNTPSQDITPEMIQQQGWCPLAPAGVVALSVMLATFMEVLDSTIVNVSLPHIAGNLSAGVDESTWVLTSYLVSNAIVLPTTGWFSSIFGRKRFFMACVAAFAVTSFLCGLAPSLPYLVFFRILQGLAGGALQPISQAILLDSYPVSRRGFGIALFGIGVVFAPIIGPTLGGWITDNFSWRWVFFINMPVGALALLLTQMNVADPPYIRRGAGIKIDYIGIALLVTGIGALQIILDKGQREDWFQTTWVLALGILCAVSLIALVVWELKVRHPILDLSIFRLPNFSQGMVLIFVLGIVLYGSLVLTPLFLQELMGYTAMLAGLALSPGGVGTLICMPIVGYLVGKFDARFLIALGLILLSMSMFMMSRWTLQISFWDAVWPRVVVGLGLGFLFVPITALSMGFVPPEKTGSATGMFNLLRNIGGSFGIAFVNTMLAVRAQFHQARLVQNISLYQPSFQDIYSAMVANLVGSGHSLWLAQREALASIYAGVVRQANTMSFLDCFWLLGMLNLILLPIIFISRKPPRHAGPPAAH